MTHAPTVLVTGAAGYVGLSLCRHLSDAGWHVIGVDRRTEPPGFPGTYRQVDLAQPDVISNLLAGVTHVAHLAALASVEACQQDPEQSEADNLKITRHVYEAAERAGVRRFVFTSSAAVYPHEAPLPQSEDSAQSSGQVYADHKLASESVLRNDRHGPDAVSLRFFNIYGPGQCAGIIAHVVNSATTGKELLIQGDGEQTRDFVNIRDACRALELALERKRDFQGLAINIGAGVETSVNALLRLATESAGHEFPVRHIGARPGDLRRSCADVRRAESELGFRCEVSLQEGMAEILRKVGNA